jgi:hypothetical protein
LDARHAHEFPADHPPLLPSVGGSGARLIRNIESARRVDKCTICAADPKMPPGDGHGVVGERCNELARMEKQMQMK